MDILTESEIVEVLETVRVMHLGVVDDEGPYVTPLSFVYLGDAIAFRTLAGRKMDAIAEDPRVCIEVSESNDFGDWRSVVAFGDAEVVEDDQDAASIIAALMNRYEESFQSLFSVPPPVPAQEAFVVRVQLDVIEGRSSGSFFAPPTRPGRL